MDYMYDPFHRRHYRNPSPFFSSTAGHPQRPHPAAAQPNVPRRRGVVSIPVIDGNQDRNSQSVKVPKATTATELLVHGAAVRIQRVFRGHLVRRAMMTVRALDAEVGDIEAMVRESIGRIATDERERVWVGETVMRVLLRLDGVRGVRGYRKKVVRRAVKLQEMIDSLAAGGAGEEVSPEEDEVAEERRGGEVVVREEDIAMGKASDSIAEAVIVEDEDARDSSEERFCLVSGSDSSGSLENRTEEIKETEAFEGSKNIKDDPRPVDDVSQELDAEESVCKPDSEEETPALSIVVYNHTMEDEGSEMKPEPVEVTTVAHMGGDRGDDVMEDDSAAEVRNGSDELSGTIGSSVQSAMKQEYQRFSDYVVVDNANSSLTEEATAPPDENSPESVPLETAPSTLSCPTLSQTPVPAPAPVETVMGRMSQENERLRGMVEQLLEQSALQCRLVCQLTRRVESLEKKVEKMGKKKRKHAGDTGVVATGKKN